MYEAIKWPEDMTPSRFPIHFTNEEGIQSLPRLDHHAGCALVQARGRTWTQLIFQDLFKKEQ